MPREYVPITPEVLQWARERSNFSLADLQSSFPKYQSWEEGKEHPTYPQIERLSDKLKVPIAVFFFPEPPDEPPIRQSFRTLPEAQYESLPPKVRLLLRKANVLQMNLSELNDGRNPAKDFILRDMRFSADMNVVEMAKQVRKYFGITLDEQVGWPDSDAAFTHWRTTLETHGIAVFKDAFGDDDYSGFCLYDDTFPLIYVNNSVKTRQIFTLFHELGHLLFHTSGINAQGIEPVEEMTHQGWQVEVVCNRFAAEFLLPAARLRKEMRGRIPNEETAIGIAEKYHISREFVYRRFLDRGEITEDDYMSAAARWSGQRKSGSTGGNHYWTKITYLGVNYINLAFSRYRQNRISEPELADYLDTKVRNLWKLENYFEQKVS